MSTPTIEFFWDVGSPYIYLASTQIDALAERAGARLEWKPFLLGKVFQATGNHTPASLPAKGKYLFKDVQLWARYYGVAFTFPKVFPINSLLPQRVACAAVGVGRGEAYAKAAMTAYWGEGRDISQSAEIEKVCTTLDLDGAALLAQATESPVKDLLRANTEEAIHRGAFGAPTFFIGEQMFWGNDRLSLMEASLKGRFAA